jgi:hypothetical protein
MDFFVRGHLKKHVTEVSSRTTEDFMARLPAVVTMAMSTNYDVLERMLCDDLPFALKTYCSYKVPTV